MRYSYDWMLRHPRRSAEWIFHVSMHTILAQLHASISKQLGRRVRDVDMFCSISPTLQLEGDYDIHKYDQLD
jgi:hypothetical protein